MSVKHLDLKSCIRKKTRSSTAFKLKSVILNAVLYADGVHSSQPAQSTFPIKELSCHNVKVCVFEHN